MGILIVFLILGGLAISAVVSLICLGVHVFARKHGRSPLRIALSIAAFTAVVGAVVTVIFIATFPEPDGPASPLASNQTDRLWHITLLIGGTPGVAALSSLIAIAFPDSRRQP